MDNNEIIELSNNSLLENKMQLLEEKLKNIDYSSSFKKDTSFKNEVVPEEVEFVSEPVGDRAQTGISGSVKIGENLVCGGQVGFAGHITIGNNVKIAAKSGVTKNIKDNSVIAGFPAIDIKLWRQSIINERKNRHQQNTGSSSS